MTLILLRHGQSEWNLKNRFTGWKDVSLTATGIEEATFSAHQLIEKKIKIHSVHTSILKRAIETTDIVTDIIGFPKENIQYDWRLNERHYGALEGLNKSETAKKYGEEQVLIWRRSYDIAPPLLDKEDIRHPKFNKKFKAINQKLPVGESLKNVIERLNPFWEKYINDIKNEKGSHLIIAHSNSLRAITKMLDRLSDEEILSVNIPTGVPLVYQLDKKLNVLSKNYLINDDELKIKQAIIKNQGKA